MKSVKANPHWNRHFGKRYLRMRAFINFCEIVGVYSVNDEELEEYEQRGLMYPAARLVMPEEYAHAFWLHQYTNAKFEFDESYCQHHELEMTLRFPIPAERQDEILPHSIDRMWGVIDGLQKPQEQPYRSWDSYKVTVAGFHPDIATHFYHYWQVYHLYQIRRQEGMYQDRSFQWGESLKYGGIGELLSFFDALSYFHHLFDARFRQMAAASTPNDDGEFSFDDQQQRNIEQFSRNYASETLAKYSLNENDLFEALKGMVFLHYRYEKSERQRLAETLKSDIWHMVELVGFVSSMSSEEISDQVGYVGPGMSRINSIEKLFPDKRKVTRSEAYDMLISFLGKYNGSASTWPVSEQDIDELLSFVENTELAIFEYVLVELNETYFDRTSWFASASFLRLKSLASFPESLMRILIDQSGDQKLIKAKNNPRIGMSKLNELLFQHAYPFIWTEYNSAGHRSAPESSEFQTNAGYLITRLNAVSGDDAFLGVTLSLATLLRNFTSHHLVENPNLLSGQYVQCVRSILNTVFFIWSDAKHRGWI